MTTLKLSATDNTSNVHIETIDTASEVSYKKMASSDEKYGKLGCSHRECWDIIKSSGTYKKYTEAVANTSLSVFYTQISLPINCNKIMNFFDRQKDRFSLKRYHSMLPKYEQNQSAFFNLPSEIRLEIYEHLLTVDFGRCAYMWYMTSANRNFKYLPGARHTLAILQTCRRALAEAEHIFYSANHFLYPQYIFRSWPSTLILNPNRLDALQNPYIWVTSSSNALSKVTNLVARGFPNLRKLAMERHEWPDIDDRAWVRVSERLKMELEKLKLRELEIITFRADPKNLKESQLRGVKRLREVDALLLEAVSI